MQRDIVVDSTVMRLYGAAKDPVFRDFFGWLFRQGVLACSQKLLVEFYRIRGNTIASLVDHLIREQRFHKYEKKRIRTIDDKHFKYTCNHEDRKHIRLVMCTYRRLCLSQDQNLVNDVNRFPGHNARAARRPDGLNYH